MITELRIYYIHPGKMEDICNRFQNHTLKLFPNHNIKVTNFWVDAEGKDIIYYTCEFDSLEAKEAAWDSFKNDPEWIKAKGKSEEAGPIVSKVESYVMENASFFK